MNDEIKVLLVDDDEVDHLVTRRLLREISRTRYDVTWLSTSDEAIEALLAGGYDVCLLDFRLDARTGLDVVHEANQVGCSIPIIMLTGVGDEAIDMAAMSAGAADYLVKGRFDARITHGSGTPPSTSAEADTRDKPAWLRKLPELTSEERDAQTEVTRQRAESLAGLCYLLTLYGFVRSATSSRPGWWLAPSVVAVDDPSSRIWREEVFGPVVAVMPFDDEAEAIALANDTEYGLSGSIWTRDLGRALRVARGVESGNLSVNSNSSVRYSTPFGGFKRSGLGRELGPDALDAFTEVKNVFFADD